MIEAQVAVDQARNGPPEWFGKALASARHQDEISRWPWWARWAHRRFIAHRCPACIYWREVHHQGGENGR